MFESAFPSTAGGSSEIRVLVVEDVDADASTASTVRAALEAEGYDVELAVGAAEGLRQFVLNLPAIVVLRTGHSGGGWIDLCRQMHELADVPIFIGFRLKPDTGAIAAFKLGVAGYVGDPSRVQELVARIRAALRNGAGSKSAPVVRLATAPFKVEQGQFIAGDLCADFVGRKVSLAGLPVHLTRLEFDLLKLLVSPAGRVHTRPEIIARLWGTRRIADSGTLDTHIRRLRMKLESPGQRSFRFITVRGVGFRFDTYEVRQTSGARQTELTVAGGDAWP